MKCATLGRVEQPLSSYRKSSQDEREVREQGE